MPQKYCAESSENIIIGTIMNNVQVLMDLMDLKAEYFTNRTNRMLYTTLKKLFIGGANNVEIADIMAFIETSERYTELLEDAGGIDYLEILMDIGEGKKTEDIRPHVDNVMKCAFKERAEETLSAIEYEFTNEKDSTVKTLYEKIETRFLDLRSQFTTGHKIQRLGERLPKIQKKLDKFTTKEFSGFPTGFGLVNKFFTYDVGELVIFSAPAKFGKSQWVVDMVYRLSVNQNVPIVVIDSELSDEFFTARLAAKIMNVDFSFVKKGHYKNYEWAVDSYNEAMEIIADSPIYHQYTSDWTQDEIRSEIKRLKYQEGLKMVIWDYLKVENIGENKKENTELANLTNFLKNKIAGELELSVVAMAQTSDYSKTEGSLRIWGSNQIKQYASTICYLVKKGKDAYSDGFPESMQGNMYLFVKENRNGAQMTDETIGINFVFDSSKASFELAEHQLGSIIDLVKDYGNKK